MTTWRRRLQVFRRMLRGRRRCSGVYPLHDVGFHGDRHLLDIVDEVLQRAHAFVETGTHVGSTAMYVARTYPGIMVYSCEPGVQAYMQAEANLRDYENAQVYNMESPRFLQFLHDRHPMLQASVNLYFLDAHGGGLQWPLKKELAFLTENLPAAYLLIDDFKVPGADHFGYERYDGDECSFEYIREGFDPRREYRLWLPKYTECTSRHHPLRGWVLIEFGDQTPLSLPQNLQEEVSMAHLSQFACEGYEA
jgi:hypothetical protein